MAITPEMFFLRDTDQGTLQQKIQNIVSEAISTGRCAAGEKMPSSRKLAAHLGVARITVTLAYAELVSNEFLVARGRSGYYVSDTPLPRPNFAVKIPHGGPRVNWAAKLPSSQIAAPQIARPPNWREFDYPFIYGQSDPKLFDHRNWRNCALQAVGRRDFDILATDHYQQDDPLLIEYILDTILPRRGIQAEREEILLTLGSQNALWIASELLVERGKHVVLENPCYPGYREVLNRKSCSITTIDVDDNGLNPERIPPNTDVVFTAPSHHCPTNVTMPIERRTALLEQAFKDDFIVVEDDYEFEVPLFKSSSPALKSLDRAGSVVYIGSFSKSLFPGLRLGYMVAPAPFIKAARALRSAVLRHPPAHVQRTVAYFLSLGHFDAQITRMSRTFKRRRITMDKALSRNDLLSDDITPHGGSSFWLSAPEDVDTQKLALKLRERSVLIEPGSAFFAPDAPEHNRYRLAYSSIPTSKIEPGIDLIADVLKNERDQIQHS